MCTYTAQINQTFVSQSINCFKMMNKSDNVRSIDAVMSRIWSIFDILRVNGVGLDQSNVILLLLSLYKDGLISRDFLFNSYSINKNELIDNTSEKDNRVLKSYQSIIPGFSQALLSLKDRGFKQVVNAIFEIDKSVLSENFPNIFDNVLLRIPQYPHSRGMLGEYFQPVELTRFICKLADLPVNGKVFNPFAGFASFGVFLDQNQYYFGQELNQKTWALGTLRIMAYERLGTSKYVCDDSILHWPSRSEGFDLIVANPPIGMRLGNQYQSPEYDFRTIEQFLIEKGVQSLKPNGKLIALLPQSFLFRGMSEQRLREYLVEEDLIDTVISLPGGLLFNIGIPLVILVLSMAKKKPGKVRFVDSKKFVVAKSPREKVLNYYELNSFIHSNKEDDEVIRIVDNRQIRNYDYNLSVPRYFKRQIDGVKLGEILEFISGQRSPLYGTGKLLRIKDLKDDKVDFNLDLSKIENAELKRPVIQLISESCLLLAMRWKTLKPTFFEFKGEPLFRSQDILSFKIKEEIVDKAYLINELHADYVQEQLESYQLGAVMPFIRIDDLMEVVIKLPSLEEQKAKVQGIYELSDKIKSLQAERNALVHGSSLTQFNEFASLKHTLGRPRQNILDWSDNLLHFFNTQREGFEALNKAFAEFYDTDIISVLKEIKRDVNFITEVLEKGENGLILSEYEMQIISLSDINSIINDLSNNGFNFKIKKLLLKGEKLKERGIQANKTLFKTLLDNLLTNANKYAFDGESAGNEVVIELSEVDAFLSFEIRNNGKPFPKNFDREKFITKYSTAYNSTGSGLGGYDIHRIATHFNNPDWVLSLNEDPLFPVRFKFQFPIKLIN